MDKSKVTGLRMPKALYDRIKAVAKKQDRTVNWVIVRALEDAWKVKR